MSFGRRILRSFWLRDVEIPKAAFPLTVGFVYFWELVIPFFMLFKRTQVVALPICVVMHWLLAPTGFLDFASLAWAILILFLDDRYHQVIEDRPFRIGGRAIARRWMFFALTMIGGGFAGLHFKLFEFAFIKAMPKGIETLTGLLFIFSALLFLWPALVEMVRERRFRGVAIEWRRIHWAYSIAIAFIVLNGMQPYLGLSTGGAYSMFSNLRTEGAASNHLLLAGNPLKMFSFQEDMVQVVESPSGVSDRGRDLEGHDVPLVEFRKMLRKWRKEEKPVPMLLRYQGQSFRSENIWDEPGWRGRDKWYDRVLDFRVIRREGPCECQW